MTRQTRTRRRAATVAGIAAALTLLTIPSTASADPAPLGNAHFTRAGAPVFADPVPGSPAIFFNQYPGAAVRAVCTGGPLVLVQGFFNLGDGDALASGWANSGDVAAGAVGGGVASQPFGSC